MSSQPLPPASLPDLDAPQFPRTHGSIATILDDLLDTLSACDRTEELERVAAGIVEIAHRLGVDLPGGDDPWAEAEVANG